MAAKPLRVLLCMMSAGPGGGGIASVNRSVIRAFRDLSVSGKSVSLRAIYYMDANAGLPPGYADGVEYSEEFCGRNPARFLLAVLKHAALNRPHLIFVDHLHLAVVAWLLRPFTAGYILFCHGIEFDGSLSFLRLRAFHGAGLRLSNSQFTARRLEGKFPSCKVVPCELGLDDIAQTDVVGSMPNFTDAQGIVRDASPESILIVGRLSASERYKGHDQLIDVFEQIVTERPLAQLWIVGAGDDLDRLKSRARNSAVCHRILFSGFVSSLQLGAAYRNCRVFAMPSRGEGFGLVYLEAMRFGKPCIASTVDAGSEVVVDKVTGFLVNPDDLEHLRKLLMVLMSNDDLCSQLGEAGRQRFNDHYRFEHFRKRFLDSLQLVPPSSAAEEQGHLAI